MSLPEHVAFAALEHRSDMVVVTDTDGTIVYVNDAFTRTTGYPASEAVGGNPRLLRSGMHPPSLYADLWDTVRRGDIWRGELINRRRDGSLYTDAMTVAPIRDPSGTVTHYLATKRDVSDTLATVAEVSPTGIAHFGQNTTLVYANHAFQRMFNVGSTDQLVGNGWLAHLSDQDAEQLAFMLTTPGPHSELRIVLPGGRVGQVRTVTTTPAASPTNTSQVMTVEDITELVRAAELARNRERFAFAVVDGLVDPTLVIDPDGRIVHGNAAVNMMLASAGGDCTDGVPLDCWPEQHGRHQLTSLAREALHPTFAGDAVSAEIHTDTAGPAGTWWLVRATPLGPDIGAVVTWTDITEAKLEELALAVRASQDDLTGLARRTSATAWLHAALQEGPVGIVFLDLNRFKQINDTYGHHAGDEVLVVVAERLRQLVRPSDLACRFGGDEFVLLVRGASRVDQLVPVIERARAAITQPIRIAAGADTVTVGVSAGAAVVHPGDDPDLALTTADEQMYADKRRLARS